MNDVFESLVFDLETVSKSKIVELMSKLSAIRKKRFKRCKTTKYGNLNRSFTDGELRRFFDCCTHKKDYLAFFLMANLGLRVGEVVKIKIDDLNFAMEKNKNIAEKQ